MASIPFVDQATGIARIPFLGDHRNLTFSPNALDLGMCSYVVQPTDKAGPLTTILFPGLTASPPEIPPAGGRIVLPSWSCSFVKNLFGNLPAGFLRGAAGRLGMPQDQGYWRGRMGSDLSSLSLLRQQAVALVQSYVGYSLNDPQFEEVTQGRNHSSGYSACGDLINFVMFRLGCRDQSIVNRDEPSAGLSWHVGENISRPYNGAKAAGIWTNVADGVDPAPGDLCLIGQWPNEQEHVFCVLDVNGNEWTSGDYGQVNASGQPSSKLVSRTRSGNKLGSRTIIGWINLDALSLSAAADMTGVENPPGVPPAGGGGGAAATGGGVGSLIVGLLVVGGIAAAVAAISKSA